jgi:hypothetical protein
MSDRSPLLSFAEVPLAAKSLALVIDDPDAPDPRAPRTVWVHWVLGSEGPSARTPSSRVTPAGMLGATIR